MRAYVAVTGLLFALLAVVHVWRSTVEGPGVWNPFYIAVTAIAVVLAAWAAWLIRSRA